MSNKQRPQAKGLRDVGTLQTLVVHSGQPHEYQHLVARFARLEHERTRLEREENMWRLRLLATEQKLDKINKSLTLLKSTLLSTGQPDGSLRRSAKTRKLNRSLASTEVSGSALPPSRTIALDY